MAELSNLIYAFSALISSIAFLVLMLKIKIV